MRRSPALVSSRCSWWALVASSGLLAGCVNVLGIDDLVYDLGNGGAGPASVGSASNTAGTLATSDASSSSGEGTTTDGSSSASDGAGGTGASGPGAGGTGGTGAGGGPLGFVVTGDQVEYRDLLRDYHAAYWSLDDADGSVVAVDDGLDFNGNYEPERGTIDYEAPGVFDDDHAVTFAGGARIEVPATKGNWFTLRGDFEPFAIVFFAKLDGPPAEPITVMSCFDDAPGETEDKGWRLTLGEEIVLERIGEDQFSNPASELTTGFTFPTDGQWHLVVISKESQFGPLLGFLDGGKEMEADTEIAQFLAPFNSLLSIGAHAGADASTPEVALDEVAFVFSGLEGDKVEDFEFGGVQVDSLVKCLHGEGCYRVP